MIAAGPPRPPPPAGPLGPSGWFPRPSRRTLVIIAGLVAAGVIATAIVAIIIANIQDERQTTTSGSAPELDFVKFEVERQEVRVGEATSILFNVQNSGERAVDDARVVVAIEPEAGRNYLSISNGTVELPALSTNARSGSCPPSEPMSWMMRRASRSVIWRPAHRAGLTTRSGNRNASIWPSG